MEKFFKKMEENKWLYILVYSVAIAVMGIILYPLMDLIFAKINGNTFIYSAEQHIARPIIFGCIMGVILYFTSHKNNK